MSKTILVTGGAGGICSEICRGLAADGLNVVVADFAKEGAEKVAAEINANKGNALAVQVDVGDPKSVAAMMEKAVVQYGQVDYVFCGAGVIAFTKSLAMELAPNNITVNCVCPGATDTPMSRIGITPDQFKKREEIPPLMDGLTQKFEIVGLVRYLLSDASKYITGQTYFLRTPK